MTEHTLRFVRSRSRPSKRPAGTVAAVSVLGALAASSCCIVPLLLFAAGIGGAWVGNLTALAPYQPIFIAVTLGFLGAGFYLAYRKPAMTCLDDGTCGHRRPHRGVKLALWVAVAIVLAAMAFPYLAPVLL